MIPWIPVRWTAAVRYERIMGAGMAVSVAVLGLFVASVAGILAAFTVGTLGGVLAGIAAGRSEGRQVAALLGSTGQASRGWRDPSVAWTLAEAVLLLCAVAAAVLGRAGTVDPGMSVQWAWGSVVFLAWALAFEDLAQSFPLAAFERGSGNRVEYRMGRSASTAREYRSTHPPMGVGPRDL